MQTLEAIKILRKMRNNLPDSMSIDERKDAEALEEGIEALRVRAACPPRLRGYITIAKTRKPKAEKLLKMGKKAQKIGAPTVFYLSFESYLKISTLDSGDGTCLCSETAKTCYDKPEYLLCGLPVIFGDEAELGKAVYLVTQKRI